MEIKANIESLKKILVDDERFYQIPDYQRPYSWDKDNVSDLVSDLTNAFIYQSFFRKCIHPTAIKIIIIQIF